LTTERRKGMKHRRENLQETDRRSAKTKRSMRGSTVTKKAKMQNSKMSQRQKREPYEPNPKKQKKSTEHLVQRGGKVEGTRQPKTYRAVPKQEKNHASQQRDLERKTGEPQVARARAKAPLKKKLHQGTKLRRGSRGSRRAQPHRTHPVRN